MFTLLHFRPDNDWSIQSKRRQVIFLLKLVANRKPSLHLGANEKTPWSDHKYILVNNSLHIMEEVPIFIARSPLLPGNGDPGLHIPWNMISHDTAWLSINLPRDLQYLKPWSP